MINIMKMGRVTCSWPKRLQFGRNWGKTNASSFWTWRCMKVSFNILQSVRFCFLYVRYRLVILKCTRCVIVICLNYCYVHMGKHYDKYLAAMFGRVQKNLITRFSKNVFFWKTIVDMYIRIMLALFE